MSHPATGVASPAPDRSRPEQTDVQRVARAAALGVPGVHALGTDSRRRLASALGRVPGATRVALGPGLNAETGPTETAIDLSVVVEAGVDIRDLGRRVRRSVGDAVADGTGHTVVEVNVDVIDVHDPRSESDDAAADAPVTAGSTDDPSSGAPAARQER